MGGAALIAAVECVCVGGQPRLLKYMYVCGGGGGGGVSV